MKQQTNKLMQIGIALTAGVIILAACNNGGSSSSVDNFAYVTTNNNEIYLYNINSNGTLTPNLQLFTAASGYSGCVGTYNNSIYLTASNFITFESTNNQIDQYTITNNGSLINKQNVLTNNGRYSLQSIGNIGQNLYLTARSNPNMPLYPNSSTAIWRYHIANNNELTFVESSNMRNSLITPAPLSITNNITFFAFSISGVSGFLRQYNVDQGQFLATSQIISNAPNGDPFLYGQTYVYNNYLYATYQTPLNGDNNNLISQSIIYSINNSGVLESTAYTIPLPANTTNWQISNIAFNQNYAYISASINSSQASQLFEYSVNSNTGELKYIGILKAPNGTINWGESLPACITFSN